MSFFYMKKFSKFSEHRIQGLVKWCMEISGKKLESKTRTQDKQ